jgi:protein-S-isoprenylcysteine O-methyltransferase Ste14
MLLNNLYRAALIFQLSASAFVFLMLLFVSAPYGKFSREGWGPRMNSLSAWVLMELPAVLTIAACAWLFRGTAGWSWVFLLFWEFHYIYRTFIFPAKMRHGRKTFPVSMVLSAVFFNLVNGFVNGAWLFRLAPLDDPSWFGDPRFIIGALLFFTGFYIHFDADRRIQAQKPGPGRYIVPEGGLYRWVSCPNYLGEIIQWTGWAILTWSPAGLAFALFTFANVFPRGLSGHRWYKDNFPEYPAGRKAVIPGII